MRIGVKPGQYGWSWAEGFAAAGADALTFVLHGERGPAFVEQLGGALRRAGWL